MFATIASYLLRGLSGRPLAVVVGVRGSRGLTGLFNFFGLLILAAHGVTLLLTDTRGPVRDRTPIGPDPVALAGRLGGACRGSAHCSASRARATADPPGVTPNFARSNRLVTTFAGSGN